MQEVTHAVYDTLTQSFQRFWRDISAEDNTQAVWTECASDCSRWYPNDTPLSGDTVTNKSHPIVQTDIPDQKTKQVCALAKHCGLMQVFWNCQYPRERELEISDLESSQECRERPISSHTRLATF